MRTATNKAGVARTGWVPVSIPNAVDGQRQYRRNRSTIPAKMADTRSSPLRRSPVKRTPT